MKKPKQISLIAQVQIHLLEEKPGTTGCKNIIKDHVTREK